MVCHACMHYACNPIDINHVTPTAKLVTDDPVFRQDDRYYLSGEEAFDRAMEKSLRYIERCRELDITDGMERNILKQ